MPATSSKNFFFCFSFGYYGCMHNFLRTVKLCFEIDLIRIKNLYVLYMDFCLEAVRYT